MNEEFEKLKEERMLNKEISGTLKGTCITFCPHYEYLDRHIRKDISKFEVNLIKKYQRSAAGKTKAFPEDIRTAETLLKTTDYLVSLLNVKKASEIFKESNLLNEFINLYSNNEFLHELYKFIEDRLRAVRLDLTVQALDCNLTIIILERIIRFYIIFNSLLYDYNLFEIHLNFEQLKRTLTDLLEIYKKRNIKNHEFVNYYILVNLNDPEAFNLIEINNEYYYKKLLIAYHQTNYLEYFNYVKRLDYLSSCILLSHSTKLLQIILKKMKRNVIDKIDINFFYDNFVIGKKEIKFVIEREGIQIENRFVNLQEKQYFEKELKIERFMCKEIRKKIILDNEFLINDGSIDFNFKRIIVKEFVLSFLKSKNISVEKPFDKDKSILNSDKKNFNKKSERKEKYKKVLHNNKQNISEMKNNLLIDKNSKKNMYPIEETKENVVKKILMKIKKDFFADMVYKLYLKNLFNININKKAYLTIQNMFYLSKGPKNILVVSKSNNFSNIINHLTKYKLFNIKTSFENEFVNLEIKNFHFIILIKPVNIQNLRHDFFAGNVEEIILNIESKILIDKIFKSKKICKERLFNCVKNKSKEEKYDFLINLICNQKNDVQVEKNLFYLQNGIEIVDCDVFFEE